MDKGPSVKKAPGADHLKRAGGLHLYIYPDDNISGRFYKIILSKEQLMALHIVLSKAVEEHCQTSFQ